MSSASKSKSKRNGKEQKASSKVSGTVNGTSGMSAAYNPILGTFHTFEAPSASSPPTVHVNGRFRDIDETDDHSGSTNGSGGDYDSASNNDTRSVESEDHKDKASNVSLRHEAVPGADNDKREKIRQKNERKHQRQKERRAQELHERCSGYLMSRKLEALAQQLVSMGFSSERATMALILNEGKVEEAVAWLFEGGEDADKHKDQNLDTGGNLKIDISEELARITEMENRFKCTKQEVERAIVACEGDLGKAEETLKVQKQEPPPMPQRSEESTEPQSHSTINVKFSAPINQSSVRQQTKPNTTLLMQQRRDEKEINYAKTATTVGSAPKMISKNVQQLTSVQPKLEWAKPQLVAAPADRRWPVGGSSPSVAYPLASPLQVSAPPSKTEQRYVAAGEVKNLQAAAVREPVVMMQRSQSVNAKQAPVSSISSSPPGASAGWYPPSSDMMKPNGLLPQIPSSTRSLGPNDLSSNQLYHQTKYQQHQQLLSGSSPLDTAGISRGNPSWNKTGTSPTLAAAASLGLFSGLGSNCSSGSTSPVDWNTGGSMPSCDYTSIDWSLDRTCLSQRPSNGLWFGLGSHPKSSLMYDQNALPLGVTPSMRPSANLNGISITGFQDGGVAVADASASGSREWTSPFEGKDLFSLPRQFVSSPSL